MTSNHKVEGMNKQKCILIVLETRIMKSACQKDPALSEGTTGGFLLISSSFWWPLEFLACSNITPIIASVLTWPSSLCHCVSSPLLIKTPIIGFRAHPKFRMIWSQDSYLDYIQTHYFQRRLHSDVWGGYEFGEDSV